MNRAMTRRASAAILLAFALGVLPGFASAAVVHGALSAADGAPLAGVMVTLRDARGRAESVFSDAQGRYRLETRLAGPLDLRLRKRYFADELRAVELAADSELEVDARLAPLTDPKALSEAHPSLSHFSRIAFDTEADALFARELRPRLPELPFAGQHLHPLATQCGQLDALRATHARVPRQCRCRQHS